MIRTGRISSTFSLRANISGHDKKRAKLREKQILYCRSFKRGRKKNQDIQEKFQNQVEFCAHFIRLWADEPDWYIWAGEDQKINKEGLTTASRSHTLKHTHTHTPPPPPKEEPPGQEETPTAPAYY